MRKVLLLLFVSLFLVSPSFAGSRSLDGDETLQALRHLDAINSGLKSLECDFAQTVHSEMMASDITSTGKIRIIFPSRLEIEMLSPYKNRIVIDPSAANNNGIRNMSAIVPLISGGLASNKVFDVQIFEESGLWKVCLDPLDQNLKVFVSQIILIVGMDDGIARSIGITDASSGYTRMDFTNVKTQK